MWLQLRITVMMMLKLSLFKDDVFFNKWSNETDAVEVGGLYDIEIVFVQSE